MDLSDAGQKSRELTTLPELPNKSASSVYAVMPRWKMLNSATPFQIVQIVKTLEKV